MSGQITKTSLSPVMAERLLVGGGLLLCLLLIANYSLGINILKSQQGELNITRSDLSTEKDNKTAIKKLSTYLDENARSIEKTSLIMANIGVSGDFEDRAKNPRSDSATFQEQFIYDVQNYAKQVGTGVAVYTFPEQATAPQQGAAGPTGQPSGGSTPQGSGSTPPTGATQTKKTIAVPSSIQATDINITFQESGVIDYTSFLKFLKLLENNTTRMYISSITLTPYDLEPEKLNQASMDITIYSRKK